MFPTDASGKGPAKGLGQETEGRNRFQRMGEGPGCVRQHFRPLTSLRCADTAMFSGQGKHKMHACVLGGSNGDYNVGGVGNIDEHNKKRWKEGTAFTCISFGLGLMLKYAFL